MAFQASAQINGSAAHESIDQGKYSTAKNYLMGSSVYCEKYNLTGKIDLFNLESGELRERKKKIKVIFDGYVFQLYGQCFALREMGYNVKALSLYSLDDNKRYPVPLPEDDPDMLRKFEGIVSAIQTFEFESFHQENRDKCLRCIYEPLCDNSLLQESLPC